jgi:hypothetical protein
MKKGELLRSFFYFLKKNFRTSTFCIKKNDFRTNSLFVLKCLSTKKTRNTPLILQRRPWVSAAGQHANCQCFSAREGEEGLGWGRKGMGQQGAYHHTEFRQSPAVA